MSAGERVDTVNSAAGGAVGIGAGGTVEGGTDSGAAPPTDRIALRGLTVFGRHGVYPDERRDGQDFGVDVALTLDTRPAAASDDVADTVDYGALAQELAAVVAGPPVNLLETLAAHLADTCLRHQRVVEAEVTVHKPHAPIPLTFTDVAVTITRRRR